MRKIREKVSSPENWNSSEQATMIQWHHHMGDAKIPKTVAEIMRLLQMIMKLLPLLLVLIIKLLPLLLMILNTSGTNA